MRYIDEDDYDDDFDEKEVVNAKLLADALAQSDKNREEEVKLANRQMDSGLLDKVIFVCKSDWFWCLLPQKLRLQRLSSTYKMFKQLMS